MLALLLLLSACRFEAPLKVGGADSGDTAAPDDSGGGGSGGGDDDTGEAQDPLDIDDDGDDYTENQGDCDDEDPTISPDETDVCDGEDDDCDEEIDEDADQEDPTEPDTDGTDLGTLEEGDVVSASATLYSDDDVDTFLFDFEDSSWSWFTLDVRVSGIPDGASYKMTLENLETGDVIAQESGETTLSATYEDDLIYEDGGEWSLTVESEGGADCGRSYLVSVSFDS